MTQEQKETLRQRFAARDCENQHEFDMWMQEANAVQHTFVDPYDKRLGEFTQRRASLMAQKSAINIQLDMLKQERVDVESARREVCALFHELKHAMIERNPRDKFTKTPEVERWWTDEVDAAPVAAIIGCMSRMRCYPGYATILAKIFEHNNIKTVGDLLRIGSMEFRKTRLVGNGSMIRLNEVLEELYNIQGW